MDQVLKDVAQNSDAVEEVKLKGEDIDLDRLAVASEDAPVVKIVNLMLVQALKEKASDIHIEPFEKSIKLRYRIDGNLIEAGAASACRARKWICGCRFCPPFTGKKW
jgi:type IV pilus assembly protein PilB